MSAILSFPEELREFDRLSDETSLHDPVLPCHVKLIELAEQLVQRYPEEADAHHMLGVAWYQYRSNASFRSWRCRMALKRAIAIEPDHQFALQYLAYIAFDQERYAEALGYQERLRPDYFLERDQE